MAEGGDWESENTGLDWNIDHDGDDDDDDEEVDTTRPFQPGGTSTPYRGGQQHEMHTLSLEQRGLMIASFCLEASHTWMTNPEWLIEPETSSKGDFHKRISVN